MLTEIGIGRRRGGEVTSARSGGEEVTGARGGGRRGALWLGRGRKRRERRGEGDGPRRERAGPRGGGEAGWAAFSNSFPFSFSKLTQLKLDPNEI
jgi:hypothetical protein